MNAKQRVHAALRREPADRVPVWMWFHPGMAARLAADLDLPASQLAVALGQDVRQSWVGNNHAMEGIVHEHEGETHRDAWGIEWVKEGPFNQIRRYPLEGADHRTIRRYAFPYEATEELLENMVPAAAGGGTCFLGCDVSPCLFEMLCRLRGMEGALTDLAAEPERTAGLLDRARDFAVHLSRLACERFALDWLWTGDDVGGQQSLMMSPASWRELIRPRLADIVAVGKARGLWVAYHSCGAIRDIIPDLIEMGVDVLNPVQYNCPGMDPLDLKREFGARLAFMGGVDTQRLLPAGTPDDVFRATRRLIEGMTADGGGYILAASHTVPPETPLANVYAMYGAAGIPRETILDRAAELRRQARDGSPRTEG
ncbi:MAG: methylcobalamin:coenzyme M methyltransferase [Lentisphaerae bacterium ADurb.BinA184]|nr:MAG: methylcobalamin:coenzyme M methyltransferase [Lentisphaerae bacterium ADurb.BinA184]